jgi:DNA-binding MarR family transcriptional regulator
MPKTAKERAPFSPLADPTRQAIFERLINGPTAVKVLAAELPITQPAVSQHLKILREAGLVTDKKVGRSRFYWVNPEILERLSIQFSGMRNQALDAGEQISTTTLEFDETDRRMALWTEMWEEHDPLSVGLLCRLRLVALYLEKLSARAAARYQLSNYQVLLLATLDRPEAPQESTMTELSRLCHISLSATSRQIELAERRGLLTCRPDADDAQLQHIRITEKGRELMHEVMRSQRDQEHAPVYSMSAEDRLRLCKMLRPLLRNLQTAFDEA